MPVFTSQTAPPNPADIAKGLVSRPDLNSDPLYQLMPDLLLYGPSGVGKTTCAWTCSEQLPANAEFPLKKRVEVTDTIGVDFDKQARLSREVLGIYAPSIDLSGLTKLAALNILKNSSTGDVRMSPQEPQPSEQLVHTLTLDNWEPFVFGAIRSLYPTVKNVIFDTVTAYDCVLENMFRDQGMSGFDLGAAMRSKLISLHVYGRTLGMRCIYIAHPRMPVGIEGSGGEKSKDLSKNMKSRIKAQGGGDASIVASISTNAIAVYRSQTCGVWPLLQTSPDVFNPQRKVFPRGFGAWEGKTQLPGLDYLNGEPPNIRAIFEKSIKFLNKQKEEQK